MGFYGTMMEGRKTNIPAHLCVFGANHDPRQMMSQAPQLKISLESSKVCVMHPKPLSSPRRRASTGMPHGMEPISCSFCITTSQNKCYEFIANDQAECLLWVNVLKFMTVFPYSSLPQEPDAGVTPFERTLDPRLYEAGQ